MGIETPVQTITPDTRVAADDKEIKRLRQPNDLYKLYLPEWKLYLSAYEGGPDFANADNLHQHMREADDDYQARVKRLHYLNYCEPLVDFFTEFIFAETIQRDGASNKDFYEAFIKDVDRKGTNISDYMRAVSDDQQIYGMSYTLVDTPKFDLAEGQVLTKQQEKDFNIRPYWILIHPDELLDWLVDDFDNLIYLKRAQHKDTILHGERRKIEVYTEWTVDIDDQTGTVFGVDVVVTRVDVTDSSGLKPVIIDKEKSILPLKRIPIEIGRYRRSKKHPFMGNSFLRDLAYNNREVLNLTSLLQEFLYRQCFNIMARESDTNIPLIDQQDGDLGSSNIMEVPKDAKFPVYVSPPSAPGEFIKAERSSIVNEMFKRAAQDTLNELFNGEKRSGFSQAQSFSKTVPFIASRADSLENLEHRLMQLTLGIIGSEWDGKILYKDRYELTNVTDTITQLVSIFRDLQIGSPTFLKQELKRVVAEFDGKIPDAEKATIQKEIDAIDFTEWEATQKEALVGGAGASPAAQQKPKQTGTTAEVAAESNNQGASTNKLKGKNK